MVVATSIEVCVIGLRLTNTREISRLSEVRASSLVLVATHSRHFLQRWLERRRERFWANRRLKTLTIDTPTGRGTQEFRVPGL
jgi:hypothetical protein